MQVFQEETGSFELWYKGQQSIQDSSFVTHGFKEDKNDFTYEHPKERTTQPRIEAIMTKYDQMNDSQLSMLTESTINKTQEIVIKCEQLNDDKISAMTKSMVDKTVEYLTNLK